jgi:hypothetical protein
MSTTIWPRVKKSCIALGIPDVPRHRPDLGILRAPAVNLEDSEAIELLDNELVWKGLFRILAIEVAATLKWRHGRRGEPEANILYRASKGLFPCCHVTMSELIGDKANKHTDHDFRKAFEE